MERAKKEELVASMRGVFDEANMVVVAHYAGLTVGEMTELRARARESGVKVKVTKNRLTRRALEGTRFASLDGLFKGQTAVTYSRDPVAAARVAVNFAKANPKLVILGGALDAQRLDPDGVQALASLPSLDELRGRLVGMLQTPATRVATVLQAPAGQVARVFGAYAKKGEAAA